MSLTQRVGTPDGYCPAGCGGARAGGWRRSLPMACLTLCLSAVSGCPPGGGGVVEESPPLPPRDLQDVISVIEANSALLDRALWSNSVDVTARLTDDEGKEHVYQLESNFLFDRPQKLRMDLRPSVGDQVMQIGSNMEDFWIWVEPEVGAMWWGRHRHVDKPCAETLSVRPDQLAAALGLDGLPKQRDGLIGPAVRAGKRFDILVYLRERPDVGFRLDREFWVERQPPYMIKVVLFRDDFGQISMSAYLDAYRRAWEGGPLVPHEISVFWHQGGGKLRLLAERMKGIEPGKVSDRAFDRPRRETLPGGVERMIQVDADCDEIESGSGEAPDG